MRDDPPTYRCDRPGCKSYCTLDRAEPDTHSALTARGWWVESSRAGERHLCPGCKPITTHESE